MYINNNEENELIMYNKLRKLKKSKKGDIACRLW